METFKNNKDLPTHIGIIMDGNRRWAKNHFLPSIKGHYKGAETFRSIAIYSNKIGIKNLTVYAFSTENWKRSEEEISYLMKLFKKYLFDIIDDKLGKDNIKIRFLGTNEKLSKEIKELIEKVEEKSSKNTGLNLNIAFNYGGRQEIVNASRIIADEVKNGNLKIEDITEEHFSKKLYTKGSPDVDLIIRTAGEERISNFMLWQSAYAEYYFTSVLWPDFNEKELDKAIEEYLKRSRRFGGA